MRTVTVNNGVGIERAHPRYPQGAPAAGNLASTELTLSTEDLRRLDEATAGFAVQGARDSGHEQHR